MYYKVLKLDILYFWQVLASPLQNTSRKTPSKDPKRPLLKYQNILPTSQYFSRGIRAWEPCFTESTISQAKINYII